MDEEAALLPDTALTAGDHAEVFLAPLAATITSFLDGTSSERLLGWAKWAFLSITLLGVLDLAHKSFWMLVGMGTGRSKGMSTNMWLKQTRKEVGKSQTKINQV